MVGITTFPPYAQTTAFALPSLTPLNFRGTWDPTITYVKNDGVYFSGSSYIAIANNLAEQPDISPLFWSIMASAATTSLDGIGTTQGNLIYRDIAAWLALAPGVANQFLQTGGPAANPAWVTPLLVANITQQEFAASGTYTPNAKLLLCLMECWGGGGGGGGATLSNPGVSCGGGGGAGGYSRAYATAATIGASQTVTIGAAGAGGTAGNNAGGNGGDTSVGALCIGKGGTGGAGAATQLAGTFGAGGVAGTGDEAQVGSSGSAGISGATNPANSVIGSSGGLTSLGEGGRRLIVVSTSLTGIAPSNANSGAGGGGGITAANAANAAGGAGAAGFVRITEYLTL